MPTIRVYADNTDASNHMEVYRTDGTTYPELRALDLGTADIKYGQGQLVVWFDNLYGGSSVTTIGRQWVDYDFSLIPPGATITAVALRGNAGGWESPPGSNPPEYHILCIQEGTQSIPLLITEFKAFTGSIFGTYDVPARYDFINLVFNQAGIDFCNSKIGQIAKFCVRDHHFDVLGSAWPGDPAEDSHGWVGVSLSPDHETDQTNISYLEITYTEATDGDYEATVYPKSQTPKLGQLGVMHGTTKYDNLKSDTPATHHFTNDDDSLGARAAYYYDIGGGTRQGWCNRSFLEYDLIDLPKLIEIVKVELKFYINTLDIYESAINNVFLPIPCVLEGTQGSVVSTTDMLAKTGKPLAYCLDEITTVPAYYTMPFNKYGMQFVQDAVHTDKIARFCFMDFFCDYLGGLVRLYTNMHYEGYGPNYSNQAYVPQLIVSYNALSLKDKNGSSVTLKSAVTGSAVELK